MNKRYLFISVFVIISISCFLTPFSQKTADISKSEPLTEIEIPASMPTSTMGVNGQDLEERPASTFYPILFSAKGKTGGGNGSEIFMMAPDGSSITCITNSKGDDRSPRWSTDASKVVFTSERDGTIEIYVMKWDGTEQKRLTNNDQKEFDPAWSTDGKYIIFSRLVEQGEAIFVMNSDGTEEIQVSPVGSKSNHRYPVFSPDGEWIVYSSFGGGRTAGIYLIRPTGAEDHLIQAGPLHNPNWSPDGKMIAFDGEPGGNLFEVYVMKSDGSGLSKVTTHPEGNGGYNKAPVFSPDGKQLLYTSLRKAGEDNGWNLFVINLDGSGERQLTFGEGGGLVHSPIEPDWLPIIP